MIDYYTLFPSFKKEIAEFFNKSNKFAVIEVTPDKDSIGYQIFENLKNDYTVFPVNSEGEEILGEKSYQDLASIPEKVDAVILSAPSEKTLEACRQCIKNNISFVWIEMGSETSESIEFCKKNNIKAIYYHSILKERANPSAKYKLRQES